MAYVLGFDIGGTKSTVILARTKGLESVDFLDKRVIPTAGSWRQVMDSLAVLGEDMAAGAGLKGRDLAVGVSCGGPLDSGRGVILSPPNLPGWDQVPVVDYLTRRFGAPAALKNDADACALAEWRFGAGKNCSHMIFLTFGTGLGAGLILNGRLYEGACGMAGEAGHIRLEKEGPAGYGKAGSFEGFCSGSGIAKLAAARAREAMAEGRTVSYLPPKGGLGDITARDVAMAAELGCEDALEVLRISGRYLGRGLAILIDLLNPERIIVGSIFARCGRFFIEEMEKELDREALPASRRFCAILPAGLGEQIGDYGAVVSALI